jgi:hypothetical protein
MSRNRFILTVVVIVIAVAAAVAVIVIEQGLAFQSQTDSTDNIEVGNFVKARDSEGRMVSITPVLYAQTEDKASYVLTNASQSVRGTMQIGTEGNADKSLTSLITFQEMGTWMLIETMDLVLQRETCFTVVVDTGTTTLEGTTVITIDSNGEIQRNYNDRAITGSWKVWGVGASKVNYNPAEHSSDAYKGFIVLVDSSYLMTYRYNVLAINGNNDNTVVTLYTPKSVGDPVISAGEWKAWNSGNPTLGYSLKSTDVYRCTEEAVSAPIYSSISGDGVAGEMTAPISVRTGTYDFSINIQYKSSINYDPGNYDGENMRSTIVFFLSNLYSVTYVNTNGPSIETETAYYHVAFISATMNPNSGYARATSVTVTMGGQPFSDFTYNQSTGVVTIVVNKIEGNIVITAEHTPEPSP